jgi:hypothetical protein
LRNLLTGEKKMIITDDVKFGEIGTCNGNWIIVDYAEEWREV